MTRGIGWALLCLSFGCSDAKDTAASQAQAIENAHKAAEAANAAAAEAQRKAAEKGIHLPPVPQPAAPGQPANIAEAMRKMQEVFAQPGQGGTVAVDPRPYQELKAMLPETLDGMRRTEISGEKTRMMAIAVSFARAQYRNDSNGRLRVKITDSGSMQGFAAMATWAMVDVERETERGYERTIAFQGNRGFEKWDSRSQHGELNFIIGSRYIIEADGNDLTMEQIKAAMGSLDLSGLR